MLSRLLKMTSLRDDEAEVRGCLIEDQERSENLVTVNKDNRNTVDAEIVMHPRPEEVGAGAFAMWPSDIELAVPEDWKVGDKVPAAGPHGRVHFDLPEGVRPGTTMRFRLKPAPDLRIEVPPGLSAGSPMTFEKSDGTRISIKVPPGKRPGDFFEVSPPALMVLVPEEVKAGETVVFCMPAPPVGQWFKAKVPEELQLGRYFAARLPPPDAARGGGAKADAIVAPSGIMANAAAAANSIVSEEAAGLENADDQDLEAPLE